MTTHNALVYVPGWPFEIATLLPKMGLASLASLLHADGHTCAVVDHGTTHCLREAVDPGLVSDLRACLGSDEVEPAARATRPGRRLDARLAEALHRRHEHIAQDLAECRPNSVALYIERTADLGAAVATAQALRARAPETQLVAWAPSMAGMAEAIASAAGCFDCVATGGASAVAGVLEHPRQHRAWALLPNLSFRDGCGLRSTRPASCDIEPVPGDGFAPSIYPALTRGGKFRMLGVELGGWRHRGAQAAADGLAALAAATGIRLFHLRGHALPAHYVQTLAHTLLHRGLSIRYSYTGGVESVAPSSAHILWASGCRAIEFQIDTGSQLLLDRVYKRTVGVARIEQALRGCKEAGLATVVRLTYPCPFDDYNTRAETLRVVERTRPNGALVEMPDPLPGSAWSDHPEAFGFLRCTAGKRVRQWLAAQQTPAASALKPPVPARGRWDGRLAAAEHADLEQALLRLKVATPFEGRLALVARTLGRDGREGQLCATMRRALLSGDAEALDAVIGPFNSAEAGASAVQRLDAAVGN